jgi:hypothetical protein
MDGYRAIFFLWTQRRNESPLCPQCVLEKECKKHTLTCPNMEATQDRYDALIQMWEMLQDKHTDPAIIRIIHGKLHTFLKLGDLIQNKYDRKSKEAVIHQNIIGWRKFLCRFYPQNGRRHRICMTGIWVIYTKVIGRVS